MCDDWMTALTQRCKNTFTRDVDICDLRIVHVNECFCCKMLANKFHHVHTKAVQEVLGVQEEPGVSLLVQLSAWEPRLTRPT